MIGKRTLVTGAAVFALSAGSAFGQDFDRTHVGLEVHDGTIVTGWYTGRDASGLIDFTPDRVFDAVFGESGVHQWGTNSIAGEFDTPGGLGYNFRTALHRYDRDEDLFVALNPQTEEQLRMSFGGQERFSDSGPVNGIYTPVRTEASNPGQDGRHHTDFLFELVNDSGAVRDGIYLIEAEVVNYTSSIYGEPTGTSKPFYFLFGQGDFESYYDMGMDDFRQYVAANVVPEPGSLALLGLGGALMLMRGRRRH